MAMATTTTTTPTPLRMKLLVDTRTQRVLFAEASKEVVDFLFSFLALPVGTVVMLLGSESVVGSVDMDALLRPVVLPPAAGSLASLFRLPDASTLPRCPCCAIAPSLEVADLMPNRYPATTAAAGGGFVQGNMTYTVMDDLAVAPMSTINIITVFNTMAVRDISAVHQRTVLIGYTEALKILKASFESNTVLTDVFVRNGAPGPLAR